MDDRTPPTKNSSLHKKHYLQMKVAQPGDAKFDPPTRDVHQKSNEEDHLTVFLPLLWIQPQAAGKYVSLPHLLLCFYCILSIPNGAYMVITLFKETKIP
ncbi:hypothetical protein MUK42_22959 [Musa troglodytarum]|uniref:Uncharacterized protein n=1 Tax=Musa troglodytarum TaxID=320322 RepID=A0A9E7GG58_9LILI|nr:hypothetical protein MUK42_22959 [Musa troglodytarum]